MKYRRSYVEATYILPSVRPPVHLWVTLHRPSEILRHGRNGLSDLYSPWRSLSNNWFSHVSLLQQYPTGLHYKAYSEPLPVSHKQHDLFQVRTSVMTWGHEITWVNVMWILPLSDLNQTGIFLADLSRGSLIATRRRADIRMDIRTDMKNLKSLFACELAKYKTAYTQYALCIYCYISNGFQQGVKVI